MRGRFACLLVAVLALATGCSGGGGGSAPANPGPSRLELFAGTPTASHGTIDGIGEAARFDNPTGLAIDAAGNLYVADSANATIRKVTPAGVVTTLAGVALRTGRTDGPASSALFNNPRAVAVDPPGNVYVADAGNHAIRRISPAGIVSTMPGTFEFPAALALDVAGNLFVADSHAIRSITPQGEVRLVAGMPGEPGAIDGPALQARLGSILGLAFDRAGNLYLADFSNATVRKLGVDGMVTTVAGATGQQGWVDGAGSAARFLYPGGIALDAAGNILVSDRRQYGYRRISPAGEVTTLVGSPDWSISSVEGPHAIAVAPSGSVYLADEVGDTIVVVSVAGQVQSFAGPVPTAGFTQPLDGMGAAARFGWIAEMVGDGRALHILDGRSLRRAGADGAVLTVAPALPLAFPHNAMAVDASGTVYVADSYFCPRPNCAPPGPPFRRITADGVVTLLAPARSADPYPFEVTAVQGLAVDAGGNLLFGDLVRRVVRRMSPDGTLTTLAGAPTIEPGIRDGTGVEARFSSMWRFALDGAGNLYMSDSNAIRKVSPEGVATTLAGRPYTDFDPGGDSDGLGTAASFRNPHGLAVDSRGIVYVADTGNHLVRRVTPAGDVTTVAGTRGQKGFVPGALPGVLDTPRGVAVIGSDLYIAMESGIAVVRNVP